MSNSRRLLFSLALAMVVAALLGAGALAVAAAGHGTPLLLVIFSAPFGVFGFWPALLSIPVTAALAGALTFRTLTSTRRALLVGWMAIHYCGVIGMLVSGRYVEWSRVVEICRDKNSAITMAISFGVYIAANIWLWCRLLHCFPGGRDPQTHKKGPS